MTKKNVTSPIRSGFDYQDLWTLKMVGEWLLTPEQYKWLHIEAQPSTEAFFLDDIVLLDQDDKYHLNQAKFKADEHYEWTWDDFLKSRKGKKGDLPSLFKKWSLSLNHIDGEVKKAVFLTNATLSKDIAKYFDSDKIDIEKIRELDQDLYLCIETEIGTENVKNFFSLFDFIFQNRSIDAVETEIINQLFYDSLGVTDHGVNNLLLSLKREGRKTYTIPILLEQIRRWCEFDNPQPLDENFIVPSDFQFFDENAHLDLMKELQTPIGGIKVIHGKPGVGKSVYLSELADHLLKNDVVTIKHHYHLDTFAHSSFERLNTERVIEAIKAQFKQVNYKKYLGDLANKNSLEISLREFIATLAQNLAKDGKSFVFIVDGLDHVIRENTVDELQSFLEAIFYPQEGLWIVFGMQPQVRNEALLYSFFEKCPSENWLKINGLNNEAVSKIVTQNVLDLNLPDDGHVLEKFLDKLFEVTNGNPLHLRYILSQLKNQLEDQLVTEYAFEYIIPYGGNIESYYSLLWKTLDEPTKSFLLTFISVEFQFTYQQFIECISTFNQKALDISKLFKKVEHLIERNKRSKLQIYHNSFEVFLLNQSEWTEQKLTIKENVKKWLENSNYVNLKWAELKKLEFYLGNGQPILEIDRQWLIEAITYPRNSSQIESQLELCYRVAFDQNDFAKALKISHLLTYYKNAQDFVDDSAKMIWNQSLQLNPECIDDLILEELSFSTLVQVMEIASEHGKTNILEDIIEILKERLPDQEYRKGEVPSVTKAIMLAIPYSRDNDVKRVYEYIIQFRDLDVASDLFGIYTEKLLLLEQKIKIAKLLNFELTEAEQKMILASCMRYDLIHQTKEFEKYIIEQKIKSPLEDIYLVLQSGSVESLPNLPVYTDFPETIPEYGESRIIWTENFYQFFLIGLIYGLVNKEDEVEEWITGAPVQWPITATKALFNASLEVARSIRDGKEICLMGIFDKLDTLPDLQWPEDREKLEFKYALKNALSNILRDNIIIKQFLNQKALIDDISFKSICVTPFFLEHDLFELVLEYDQPILEYSVYERLFDSKYSNLEHTINVMSERSEEYVKLANLSFMYSEVSTSKELLLIATDNYLGYGYHKDIYLFDVLEAVEFCVENGTDEKIIENWIKRIIPIIANVGDYTDGDETHNLPTYLSDFMAQYKQKLLFKYYFYQANIEELYSAEEAFKYVIRSLDFNKDIEVALATTALDSSSFNELKEIDLVGAKQSVEVIEDYLGPVHYSDENYSSSHDFKEEVIDYEPVPPDNLEQHLNKMETKWDYNKYVTGWTKYWLEKGDKEVIYQLIKSVVIKNKDLKSVDAALLDILYPLSCEFDIEEAFQFLSFAQLNDHGWDKYWTAKRNAELRWKFIKEKYPKRYMEFFQNSVLQGFPLSRGVEYFILFDERSLAESITEASIEFVEELMANLVLPNPEWAGDKFPDIDELDFLFQRLVWPSPLVRERAAIAIGSLLVSSSENKEIFLRLLSWISSWKIESIIAISLLPIVKAFQMSEDKNILSFITIESVISAIQVNSVVIEEILKEIALESKEKIAIYPQYKDLQELPGSYQPNEFFRKYIKMILAPIYFIRAEEIEGKIQLPFIDIWAYTAELILSEQNIDLNSNQSFYGRHKDAPFLTGFSTKVSEVYRSAFLRVVHDFYTKGLVSHDFYLEYSFATLPIDLSLWKILPNRAPEWWPKLKGEEKEGISTIQFEKSIENLIDIKVDNKIILVSEGAIEPAEGWEKSPRHSFSLMAFAYKTIGPVLPEPENIIDNILWYPQTTIIPSNAERPLSYLKNQNIFDFNTEPFQYNDLQIFPLLARDKNLTINLWQYFRDKNQSLNAVSTLHGGLTKDIKMNYWDYEDETNKEIIIFQDWLEGLEERYSFDMPIPHGQFVLIDEDFLSDLLNTHGLKIGYILKTTFRAQEHSSDEIKKVVNLKFINVNNIII